MSETLNRLERLGYVTRTRSDQDGRVVELRLSPQGSEAMAATSVLNADRVRELLARLSPAERRLARQGIALLSAAANRMPQKSLPQTKHTGEVGPRHCAPRR